MHNPEGLGLVPVQLGGHLLDPGRVHHDLAGLAAGPQRAGRRRTVPASRRSRCVPRPASAHRARPATDRRLNQATRGRWRIVRAHCLPSRSIRCEARPCGKPALRSAARDAHAGDGARARRLPAQAASTSTAALDLVSRVPRAVGAGPDAARWCATAGAGARWASSPPPTCATRCCAPLPPAAAGGARGGALRPGRGRGRRRPVRGAVADGAPPRAPPGGARRRPSRAGRARPARPGQLRRQPLAHRRAADRRGRLGRRSAGRGAAHRRMVDAAARQRHRDRAHRAAGGRAQPRGCSRGCGRCVAPAELVANTLPAGDGQRRPRRADPQDRPGQRAAAARRLRAGRSWPRSPRASTPR